MLLICGIMIISCKKDHSSTANYSFEATVIGLNQDCQLWLIKFDKDTAKVESIAGKSVIPAVYNAVNLPENLKAEGTKIRLDIRALQNKEIPICTTMGPTYNSVYVVSAAKQ